MVIDLKIMHRYRFCWVLLGLHERQEGTTTLQAIPFSSVAKYSADSPHHRDHSELVAAAWIRSPVQKLACKSMGTRRKILPHTGESANVAVISLRALSSNSRVTLPVPVNRDSEVDVVAHPT